MSKTKKDFYHPVNPIKCNYQVPYYKSSWELTFMRLCDHHPAILKWAYEPVKIPYRHPFTEQYTVYVPDFVIVTTDGKGNEYVQVIEIKPKKEKLLEYAKDDRSRERWIVNQSKWAACEHYSRLNGWVFKVLDEDQIFDIY